MGSTLCPTTPSNSSSGARAAHASAFVTVPHHVAPRPQQRRGVGVLARARDDHVTDRRHNFRLDETVERDAVPACAVSATTDRDRELVLRAANSTAAAAAWAIAGWAVAGWAVAGWAIAGWAIAGWAIAGWATMAGDPDRPSAVLARS
jgi:hypothetical protein